MKIKMIEELELVITPESYVEQVALKKWSEENKSGTGLLIEGYKPLNAEVYTVLRNQYGLSDKTLSELQEKVDAWFEEKPQRPIAQFVLETMISYLEFKTPTKS